MKLDEATWAEIRVAYETTTEPARRLAGRYGIAHGTLYARTVREEWGPRPALAVRVVPKPPLRAYTRFTMPVIMKPAAAAPRPVSTDAAASPLKESVERHKPLAAAEEFSQAEGQHTAPSGEHEAALDAGVELRLADALALPEIAPELLSEKGRAELTLRITGPLLELLEKQIKSCEGMTPQDMERYARAMSVLSDKAETAAAIIKDGSGKDASNKDTAAHDGRDEQRSAYAEAEQLRHEIAERIERLNAKWLAEGGPPRGDK